jgi:hypothetical protein
MPLIPARQWIKVYTPGRGLQISGWLCCALFACGGNLTLETPHSDGARVLSAVICRRPTLNRSRPLREPHLKPHAKRGTSNRSLGYENGAL